MRIIWITCFSVAAILLLAACQTAGASLVLTDGVAPLANLEQAGSSGSAAPDTARTATETDECLKCHTDKERLIETAEIEEAAESESKGVG